MPDRADTARLERLDRLSWWLDSRWRIPGTNWRFGIDGAVGLFPVIGDTAAAAVSAYLVAEAARSGAPPSLLARMAANAALDWLIGSVPIAGTVFDVIFKANRRNVALLREHIRSRASANVT